MVSGEQQLPAAFSRDGENVRWSVRLGTRTYGNPTVANGRVFVGTDSEAAADPRFGKEHPGVVKCLSEASGELQWQLVVPERKHGLPVDSHFLHQDCGVCSSPAVDGDRVYVVTSAAEIVCLDVEGMANGNDGPFTDEGSYMAGHGNPPVEVTARDADILWCFDPIDEAGVMPHDAASCSVLIHGDFLYTSSSNGVGGMPGATFFSKHAYVVRPERPPSSCSTRSPGSWLPGIGPTSASASITGNGPRRPAARSAAGLWSSSGAATDSATHSRHSQPQAASRWT